MKEILKTNRYEHLMKILKENDLVLLSGASTSGKTYIPEYIDQNNSNIVRIKSVTTRPARLNEKGNTYHKFVSKEDFDKMEIIHPYEFPEGTGHMYGYEKKEVMDKINSGKKAIMIVAPEAIEFYQNYFKHQNIKFKSVYWHIDQITVEKRYVNRINVKDPILLSKAKRDDLIARMQASSDDARFYDKYDYVIDATQKIEFNNFRAK